MFEPRLLFPDKPYIASDSQMVRKYSGVIVAGEEQNTDIAFGYAAESYVDYGVPGMFVPAFIWALFIGVAIALIFREYHHRDMAVSVVTVIGWMSLYLFERSWAKTIGLGGTLLIYAGGLCYILDRLWFEKFNATCTSRAGRTTTANPTKPRRRRCICTRNPTPSRYPPLARPARHAVFCAGVPLWRSAAQHPGPVPRPGRRRRGRRSVHDDGERRRAARARARRHRP